MGLVFNGLRVAVGHAALALLVATGSIEVAFAQPLTVAGRVTDDSGTPLSDVTVQLRRPESNDAVETVTDARGRYELRAQQPGRYDVRFSLINFSHLTR